jgi:hypothetical protein
VRAALLDQLVHLAFPKAFVSPSKEGLETPWRVEGLEGLGAPVELA